LERLDYNKQSPSFSPGYTKNKSFNIIESPLVTRSKNSKNNSMER
jgi:hypothetical protein